jgi:serine/threonine-protein phosphatase PP1 catalytic subunit
MLGIEDMIFHKV